MKPSLRLLHSPQSLVPSKLAVLRRVSTDDLIRSLKPGQLSALRVKKSGLVMNGNHRLAVLMERGIDVNLLPREELEDDAK